MKSATKNRTTMSKVLALGFLVAALLATLLSSAPAGADVVPAGNARSWGDNYFGQLGNGTSGAGTGTNVPGAVRYIDGVKSTKAGCAHGLALKTDGTVRAWGDDESSQLGDGGFLPGTDKAVPVRVKNLSGVKAVAAGGFHSLALLPSGKVKSWGANLDGQLGNDRSGIGTEKNTPVSVSGLTNVRSISGGAYHSLAVLEGGRARSWGDNEYGQLGNGNTGTDSDVPVAVRNLLNVRNMDGGYEFPLATTG